MSTTSHPFKEFETDSVATMLEHRSSLFIGLGNGLIIEWNKPGEQKRSFVGHSKWIICLLASGKNLWSSSTEKIIKLWNIETSECIHSIQMDSQTQCLVQWKHQIISGQSSEWNGVKPCITVWNIDGSYKTNWNPVDQGNMSNSSASWNNCQGVE